MNWQKIKQFRDHPLSTFWLWVALSFIALGTFLIITSEMREAVEGSPELIEDIDQYLSANLLKLRNPSLNEVAIDLTALGSGVNISILTAVVSTICILKRSYLASIQLLFTAVGAGLIGKLLKFHFERARPDIAERLVIVSGYSYPSGHSLASAAIYFTCAILLFEHFKKYSERVILLSLAVTLILLIGLSRVYLGVHFASDVLAGLSVGVGWSALVGSVFFLVNVRRARSLHF